MPAARRRARRICQVQRQPILRCYDTMMYGVGRARARGMGSKLERTYPVGDVAGCDGDPETKREDDIEESLLVDDPGAVDLRTRVVNKRHSQDDRAMERRLTSTPSAMYICSEYTVICGIVNVASHVLYDIQRTFANHGALVYILCAYSALAPPPPR